MKLSELIKKIGEVTQTTFVESKWAAISIIGIENPHCETSKFKYKLTNIAKCQVGKSDYYMFLEVASNSKTYPTNLEIKRAVLENREDLIDFGFVNDFYDSQDTEPQKLMEEAKELLLKESIAPKDNVNHPSHYNQGKIECIEAIESATIGKSGIEAVCVANVIKYLWRYEEKGGIESVEKAMWYLHKLLAKLEVKE